MFGSRQEFGTTDDVSEATEVLGFDPWRPTNSHPGKMKVEVMAARYAAGLPIFNGRDATYEDETTPPVS